MVRGFFVILFAGLLRRLVATAALVDRRFLALLRRPALEIRARSAMPAAAVPAVAVVALIAVLAVAVLLAGVVLVGILLRCSAGDEGGQAANVAAIGSALLGLRLRLVLLIVRPRLLLVVLIFARLLLMVLARLLLVMLRLLLVMLLLRLLLLMWIVRLILAVRPDPVLFAFVKAVVAAALRHALLLRLLTLLRLLIVIRILLPKLFLRRRDQPEVMLGVLVVILGCDRVAGALRIAGELDVLLRDVGGGAANFHIGPVRLVNPCQRILALAAMAAATPHTLLAVSHGVSVRQPLIDCGLRRDLSNLKVPRAEANCAAARHPTEHYLPTPRRMSRAVARTSALLSRVSKRSQCRAFAALPTSGNAQSSPNKEHHAQPLKHPDPIWRFRCRLRLPIRPGLHPRLMERSAPGLWRRDPHGSIPWPKASLSERIIQEVFSRGLNALQS